MKQFPNNPKRAVASFVPYKRTSDSFQFYLQRRDLDAKRLPDWFGLFGGGLEEGETPDQAFLREVIEELNFDASKAIFFNRYEFFRSINHVYILEVDDAFENAVEVREGQYGKFFSEKEAQEQSKLMNFDKLILAQIAERLRKDNLTTF